MENALFIGKEGSVEPVQRRAWKIPFFIGAAIAIGFAIYEIVKVYHFGIATDVLYIDYDVEIALRVMGTTSVATIAIIVIALLLAAMIRASSREISKGRFYLIFIAICIIMLVVSLVLAVIRFTIDVRIFKQSTFPWYGVWMYRFMDGADIILEWLVIPDIILNGAFIIGVILMTVSIVDLFAEVSIHENIMETGLDAGDETCTMNGTTFTLDCKVKNGIKACNIK